MQRQGIIRLTLAVALAVGVWPASAQTDREAVGPSREVVQERLYVFDGRFDLSLMGGVAMNPKLIDHYAFLLRPAYHLTDAWSLELVGGFVLAQERQNLTNRAREGIRVTIFDSGDEKNEFADMGKMQWVAQAAVRWSPVYGKLNLAAEVPIHFGAYASAGGGVMGIHRESLADCESVVPREDGYVDYSCATDSGVKPGVMLALGLRFYVSDWIAVRTEMSSFMFPDEYQLDLHTAEPRTVRGITNVLMFLGGVSFIF